MLITINNFNKFRNQIGSKALRLKELKEMGLMVPDFLVIPADFLIKNTDNSGAVNSDSLGLLVKGIIKNLDCALYAIRSSALVEDSRQESFAGQFMTKVAVNKKELEDAVNEVAAQAYKYLKGEVSKFSIIVQKFIEPDVSGVTFTRSPRGSREMCIESVSGRGEKLVGGKSKPDKYAFYWNQEKREVLVVSDGDIDDFKNIEKHFSFPQDIEWCVKGGVCYFLQSRPITNILESDYNQMLYLDDKLKNQKEYYYKKTEISEIASRPKLFTLSLLKKIYGVGGPIEEVYSKFKIKYETRGFLDIIGNELYVNKEEELKTLFPAKSYLHTKDFSPEIVSLRGFVQTFKNTINFNRINYDNTIEKLNSLKERNSLDDSRANDTGQWLKIFFDDYKVVFEINLLAGITLNKLKQIASGQDEINMPALLSIGSDYLGDIADDLIIDFPEKDLIGNSLDVGDESLFNKNLHITTETAEPIRGWLERQAKNKRDLLLTATRQAVINNYLREYGRWLIVKRINRLRKILFSIAIEKKINNKKNIYFATIDELLSKQFSDNDLIKRKKEYLKYKDFNLPNTLLSKFIDINIEKPIGVSSGTAKGVLVDMKTINHKEKNILYTKILSPNLVEYFDKVEGIISESGGLLSHLSIIAREKGMPVVVNFNLKKSGIRLNDIISMDGERGEVIKAQKSTNLSR